MIDLTEDDVAALILTGESEKVEFKSSFNDETLETIGAFSNAKGGTIFIGVKDSGLVCGVQIGKKSIEDIVNRIQAVTDPRIQPSVSVIIYEGKKLLGVQVDKCLGVPISVRGRFFKRSGRTNQRMSHEEIMQRMVSSTGLSWDACIEPDTTINELDERLINRFIQAAKKLGRRPIPNQITSKEFLRKLELIKDNTPTRAALLLFGKYPDSYYPTAFLKAGRFRSPTMIIDDREIHGAIINQLDEAMSWFRERLATEFVIAGESAREVRWEYPLTAIREAIINVLCHRDYTSGAHSQLRLYDDHLEFWNAGGLPSPLTPESLFQEHDSIPRNRKIAEVFFYMGFIERWGSGTLRIVEELSQVGFAKPTFTSESGRFKLVLYKQALTDEQLKDKGLSERQLNAIAYLKNHVTITNTDYQQVTGVSKRTATRDLNGLVEKGILIAEGGERGRGKHYKLRNN